MKQASALGIALLVLAGAALAEAAPDPFPGSSRAYLVRVDGATLWAASADTRLPPASLTKLMAALVVHDAVPADAVVTVDARAARAIGARIKLGAGTRIAVGELMHAMLLRSANDACLALAEHVAGSEIRFVARMNARAHAMGLRFTRFANACGFDAAGHYSSAHDLALIADAFLAQRPLAAIVAKPRYVARAVDGKTYAFANTNALIGRVPGTVGVKTGYTGKAGHCLIGLVERDGVRVLVVMLGARDRWWDAVAMIEQAFERTRAATLAPRLK